MNGSGGGRRNPEPKEWDDGNTTSGDEWKLRDQNEIGQYKIRLLKILGYTN